LKKFLLLLIPIFLSAKVHYAKVEPFDRATIKASVGGIVTDANLSLEGKRVSSECVVQIDDALDQANLKNSQKSLELMKQMQEINNQMLEGLKESVAIKRDFYQKVKSLSSSSQAQIDNANMAYIAAKNQMLGIKEKISTLAKQTLDMQYKIAMLKKSISNKHIAPKGRYIYKIMVHTGEFAAPGMPLVIADDLSRAKLTLYLDRDELKGIENKKIFIDGNETTYKIDKIWKEADTRFISAYRAQIILPPKYPFSSLLKVEIK